jgi:hypothetical protein
MGRLYLVSSMILRYGVRGDQSWYARGPSTIQDSRAAPSSAFREIQRRYGRCRRSRQHDRRAPPHQFARA